MTKLTELRAFLATHPPGALSPSVIPLLVACWDDLKGGDEAAMASWKLKRAEALIWQPPIVRFDLERHGAIVAGGSTRGDVQRWTVDVEHGTARCETVGRRQVAPMASRLDVRPLADDIARHVTEGSDHHALRWTADRNSFRVDVAHLIPATFKQTTASRRRRLRDALRERLAGWQEVAANKWQRR